MVLDGMLFIGGIVIGQDRRSGRKPSTNW